MNDPKHKKYITQKSCKTIGICETFNQFYQGYLSAVYIEHLLEVS